MSHSNSSKGSRTAGDGGGEFGAEDDPVSAIPERGDRSLPTGVDALDRHLRGGVPAGSLTAVTAAPISQSEILLYELAAARRTAYLTTRRVGDSVRRTIHNAVPEPEDVRIVELDRDRPFEHVYQLSGDLPEGTFLIVDPLDPLERADDARFEQLLANVRRQLFDNDSAAFLHCLDGRSVPDRRDVTEYMADIVLDISVEVPNETVKTRLTVPKYRGGPAPVDTLRLELTDEVTVDHSREIA